MWWFKRALIGCLWLGLGACAEFRPLHMPVDGHDLNRELATIILPEPRSRSQQILRNEVVKRLNPANLTLGPEYRLDLRLSRKRNSLAVQLDDSVTRYDMVLRARATLVRLKDQKAVYTTNVRRVASYNVLREPFATLVAEQDAERRASVEIANQIRALLALYFEKAAREIGS